MHSADKAVTQMPVLAAHINIVAKFLCMYVAQRMIAYAALRVHRTGTKRQTVSHA